MQKWNIHRLQNGGKNVGEIAQRVSTTITGSRDEAEEFAKNLTKTSQHRVFVARRAANAGGDA